MSAAATFRELVGTVRAHLAAAERVLQEAEQLAEARRRPVVRKPKLQIVGRAKPRLGAVTCLAPRDVADWLRRQGVKVDPVGATGWRVSWCGHADIVKRDGLLAMANEHRQRLGQPALVYGKGAAL